MFKKINTKLLYILALTFGFAACNLDEFPSDKLPEDLAWQTVQDAVNFQKGCYAYFRSLNAGVHIYGSDVQSDLLNATIGYGNSGGDLYRWDFTSSQYDVKAKWDASYSLINNANKIISNIGGIEANATDDKDLAKLATIKGEGYMFRAITYHNLALRFAKDFEPETAENTLGLPLVKEYNLLGKPSRSSLKETYEFIKEDIKKARELLTTEGKQDAIYFTIDVIDAFEARVNLYMHDYKGALELAKKNVDKYPLIKDLEAYKTMWKNDESTEVIFKAFRSVDEASSELSVYLRFNEKLKAFSPNFVPTQTLIDMFEENDIRKKGGFTLEKVSSKGDIFEDIILINKYPGNDALTNQANRYYNMVKVFRIAEQYLIASESAYLDKNEGVAKEWLNKLRTARGASEVTATGEELFKAIQNEWVIEFFGEGMRLDQLKRWHLGFKRGSFQNGDLAIQIGRDLEIAHDNMKFVWEVPDQDRAANPNILPNW